MSAKLGTNIDKVFEAIIERLPFPNADKNKKLRALLFDSWYDRYRGVLCLVYLTDGNVKIGDNISSCHSKKSYEIKTLSVLRPNEESVEQL